MPLCRGRGNRARLDRRVSTTGKRPILAGQATAIASTYLQPYGAGLRHNSEMGLRFLVQIGTGRLFPDKSTEHTTAIHSNDRERRLSGKKESSNGIFNAVLYCTDVLPLRGIDDTSCIGAAQCDMPVPSATDRASICRLLQRTVINSESMSSSTFQAMHSKGSLK